MNNAIRQSALTRNPFAFRHIKNLQEGSRQLLDGTPCVVMASPGMLQSGFSRQLLETWCEDPQNAVVLTGYSVEGVFIIIIIIIIFFFCLRNDGQAVADGSHFYRDA
jgi:Cft2 family RNA processing exonuclease